MTRQVLNTVTSCADPEAPETLTVAAARERILQSVTPIETVERLALRDGLSRILAENIVSPMDVPGHTNSAMDGFAMSGEDLPHDFVNLHIIGTAYAGASFQGTCRSGECVRIMTGAPMPEGTDTVVMQEQTMEIEEEQIRIGSGHRIGQNVRQAGEDIALGTIVLEAGRQLIPADLGMLASLGFGEISVRRRPKVAFFSTGDELRSVGEPLKEGELYDSNRYTLFGMLQRAGTEVIDLGVVKDDPEALSQAFTEAAKVADVVLSSGGVSVGEADYTKSILQKLGEMQFWKIAMKPGRPLTFGHLQDALFFGLPGNPVAVMVTFYQFVQPALHTLSTGEPYLPFTLQACSECKIRKRPGRFEFIRGRMKQTPEGTFSVLSLSQQGSGILSSMSKGDCFILLDASCDGVDIGDTVTIQPFFSLV
ncbi:MAG: molybdopterin molybdenumtransferase MoeA [Candidatus Thiodiazotropha sp. (ex Notomyrtea botanica)]|nr:molybdopterin molybdenumtransferase MoeA [Candidatus Thiodiazotropha sp. (ex Notomyrtea botanica)]